MYDRRFRASDCNSSRSWEDPPGVFRVGDSRVLLELVLDAFKRGESPEAIVRSYRDTAPGRRVRGHQPLPGEPRLLRRISAPLRRGRPKRCAGKLEAAGHDGRSQ